LDTVWDYIPELRTKVEGFDGPSNNKHKADIYTHYRWRYMKEVKALSRL
jgi:hypothetical protein